MTKLFTVKACAELLSNSNYLAVYIPLKARRSGEKNREVETRGLISVSCNLKKLVYSDLQKLALSGDADASSFY